MRIALIAAVAATIAAVGASTASASSDPLPLDVWAKARGVWTKQAQAAGKPITCGTPKIYLSERYPSGRLASVYCSIGSGNGEVKGSLTMMTTHITSCDYRASMMKVNSRGGWNLQQVTLDVCTAGWLAKLPPLRR